MAENGNGKSFWLTALQTVGFPIVAAGILAWFAYTTINWEREQMMPAIRDNATALVKTCEMLEKVEEALHGQDKK